MTGDGFGVDPAVLAARAERFEELAARARAVRDTLAAELDAAERPWGEDAVGASFELVHAETAAGAREAVETLPESLAELGRTFADAASVYRAADDDAVSAITDAGRTR